MKTKLFLFGFMLVPFVLLRADGPACEDGCGKNADFPAKVAPFPFRLLVSGVEEFDFNGDGQNERVIFRGPVFEIATRSPESEWRTVGEFLGWPTLHEKKNGWYQIVTVKHVGGDESVLTLDAFTGENYECIRREHLNAGNRTISIFDLYTEDDLSSFGVVAEGLRCAMESLDTSDWKCCHTHTTSDSRYRFHRHRRSRRTYLYRCIGNEKA